MDPITLSIVALISLVIGYSLNALLSNRRGSKDAPSPAGDSSPLKAGSKAADASSFLDPALQEDKTRLTMVTFWREQPSGVLRADMDGQTIKISADLTPEQRRRLVNVVSDLGPWLASAAPMSTEAGISSQAASASPQVVISQPILRPVEAQAILGAAQVTPAANAKPAPPKSIVGQIDDVLQDKIIGTPLENRGIRLVELPNHGVAVKVGMKQYNSIDEVPDPEIQTAIRVAVKLWENRAG